MVISNLSKAALLLLFFFLNPKNALERDHLRISDERAQDFFPQNAQQNGRWKMSPNLIVIADLPDSVTYSLYRIGWPQYTPSWLNIWVDGGLVQSSGFPIDFAEETTFTVTGKKIELRSAAGTHAATGIFKIVEPNTANWLNPSFRIKANPSWPAGAGRETAITRFAEPRFTRVCFNNISPNDENVVFNVIVDGNPITNSTGGIASWATENCVDVFGKEIFIEMKYDNTINQLFDVNGTYYYMAN